MAARVYGKLAGRDALPDLRRMAADADPAIRSAGIEGLADTGLKEVAPQILEGFKSADADVRSAAGTAAADLRLKEGLPHLASLLKDPDEGVRYNAIYALEQYGNRAAAKELLPLLKDKDDDIRAEAFRIFGDMRIREGGGEIAKLLGSENFRVRQGAMKLLAVIGARESFDLVARGLKDESKEIQTTAIHALGALDPPRAVRVLVPLLAQEKHWEDVQEWITEAKPRDALPELKKMLETEKDETVRARIADLLSDAFEWPKGALQERLEDKDPKVRASALAGLSGFGRTADAAPHVVKRLKDPEPEVRFAAVGALERFQSKEILAALADPDPEVLCAAIRGVKALELKESTADLLKLLDSPQMMVCQEAAETLGKLGAEEAASALVRLSRSPLPYVRASAALALRGLKKPEARSAVEELLKDPHPYVRRMASQPESSFQSAKERARSVKAMTKLQDLADLLEDPDPTVLEAAALRLVEIGTRESVVAAARAVDLRDFRIRIEVPREAVAGVMDLLKDSDEDVRARAAGALSAVGAKEAAPRLLELLGGRSSNAIIDALAGLDAREAIPKIATFLDHRDAVTRLSAVEALGRLKGREAEPRLIELLEDPDRDVRHAAALALAALESREAQPKLIEMLADEDPYAAAALCLLGRREGIPVILSAAEDLIRLRGDFLDLDRRWSQGPTFLFALNALRAPEARARLAGKALGGPVDTTYFEIARRVAGEAGMAFEGEGPADEPRKLNVRLCRRGDLWTLLFSAAIGVERSLSDSSEREVILDEGKIRFVDFEDALRFWQAWAGK